ncbi:MAG TPA: MFS transporter, partial [Caldimonas sp.]
HHAELAEHINSANGAATSAIAQLGAAGYDSAQAMATINRMIDQQAYTLAVDDLFFVSAIVFVLLLVFVWAAKPAKNAAVAAAGAH